MSTHKFGPALYENGDFSVREIFVIDEKGHHVHVGFAVFGPASPPPLWSFKTMKEARADCDQRCFELEGEDEEVQGRDATPRPGE